MTRSLETQAQIIGYLTLKERHKRGVKLSAAHDRQHLTNVAALTGLVGDVYGFSEREKDLGHLAGFLHDVIRNPNEDQGTKDDVASANEALRILEKLSDKNILDTTEEERQAIYFSISHHGHYPTWLADETTRENNPTELKYKLWMALFVADKIEANGARVIARRSSFVAGDRLHRPEGDLQTLGFKPDKDEALVVAIESVIRLSFINPEYIYPKKLQFLTRKLYELQRTFVRGIFKSLNLNIEDVAKLLIDKGIIAKRKKDFGEVPQDVNQLSTLIATKSGIDNQSIKQTSEETAAAALETVAYFSSQFTKNIEDLVTSWCPDNQIAQTWQGGMLDYAAGTWLKRKHQEALKLVLAERTLHDETSMPLTMGSASRVPIYALSNWGLASVDERIVVKLYEAEWGLGTPEQLGLVTQASKEAGFGDHPELLRQTTAKIVAEILKNKPGDKIRLLDIGSGPGLSVERIWQALPPAYKAAVEFTLIDPALESLKAAEALMKQNGINSKILHMSDMHIPEYIKNVSIDIITGVASIHHHSRIPFEYYFNALKPGGIAVFADWHNSLWEHPYRVLQFLKQFQWPDQSQGLLEWQYAYPNAIRPFPEPPNAADRHANTDITEFWLAYNRILKQNSHLGANAIWPLEGHRPVKRYIEGMEEAGFQLDTNLIKQLINSRVITQNPNQLLPNSSLLMVTIGQKPL